MEITLSEAQNGAQLAVYMDDILVVRLSEIPGDGYRWTLASVDTSCLETVEHRYEAARAGAANTCTRLWRFRPKRAGRTRLVLTRLRDWTVPDLPAEWFAVDLDIR